MSEPAKYIVYIIDGQKKKNMFNQHDIPDVCLNPLLDRKKQRFRGMVYHITAFVTVKVRFYKFLSFLSLRATD
jgi:hypothetical protein